MFHWLEFIDWQNACKLLDYQQSRKAENKHFNTFSMNAYQSILTDEMKQEIETEDFFKYYIQTGFILSDETRIYSNLYPQPKGVLKYRKWIFLSLHMRLLYYAIGLHFARIIKLNPVERVQARYGGDIQSFDTNGKLQLTASSVYYKKSYSSFYKKASIRAKDKLIKKIDPTLDCCVIRLDIENFFEHIDIDKLFTQGFAFENDIHQNKRLSIKLFLQLLNQNHQGLPQTCNDVVAGYISWLYLRKFDEALSTYMSELKAIYKFRVERYCDDTHIFIYFLKGQNEAFVKQVAKEVINWCKSFYWKEYQLRLNNKSVYYHLNNEKERKDYQTSLKITSQHEDFLNFEVKPYNFKEWLKTFTSVLLFDFVEADLYQDDFGAGNTEALKIIYDKRFNATLLELLSLRFDVTLSEILSSESAEGERISVSTEIAEALVDKDDEKKEELLRCIDENRSKGTLELDSSFIVESKVTFVNDFKKIRQAIEKLDLTHLVYQPRVFAILAPFYPQIAKLLLEASPTDGDVSYEWALSHFALEDFEQKEAFQKNFAETKFKRSSEAPSKLKHPVVPKEVKEELEKKLSYLSYFTCNRRFAEVRGNYNEAVNYLNSELCILLHILNPSPSSHIPSSLLKFQKQFKTSNLSLLNDTRNNIDLSHNAEKYPEVDTLARVVTKEEYCNLKQDVFSDIHTISSKGIKISPPTDKLAVTASL
jgi:hypothetical protein